MSTLRWTTLTGDDVAAWSDLTSRLAEADQTGEVYDAEDLAEELAEHGFDPARDSWAVWDGGQLVGFGQLRVAARSDHDGGVRCTLGGGVHPGHRGRGIGIRLLGLMEARADELAAERHPGLPHHYRAGGGCLAGDPVRPLLEHRGYRVVRYFDELARPLPGEPSEVAVPDGVALVEPTEELREPVRDAHNRAFADHWGSTESTVEAWAEHWAARSARPALSTVAVAGDGTVLGYVLCGQWTRRELYVTLVGTVPEARGRGVARAALADTVRRAGASGDFDVIELGVDSESPTGAGALYAGLGFSRTKQFTTYRRDA